MLALVLPLLVTLVPLPCPSHRVGFTVVSRHSEPLLAAASRPSNISPPLAPVAPLATFVGIHSALSRALIHLGVTFPATLIGMIGGFTILCLLPRTLARRVEEYFEPGSRLLQNWLAAIFAPGFIALPLVMPPVGAADLGMFLLLCAFGLPATIATNAAIATVLAPRRPIEFEQKDLGTPDAGPPQAPPTPFPAVQQKWLVALALIGGAAHLALRDSISLCVSLLATTLGSFSIASTRCSAQLKLWLHPFLTCSLATLCACGLLGSARGTGGASVLRAYMAPGGAGHLLCQLMGPTVLSFAFQLYRYRAALRRRAGQIMGTATLGAFVGLLMSAASARLVRLAPALRLALLSRSTISALAVEICALFGVRPPALGLLAAFATGLLAFPCGKAVLDGLGVRDPAARGLALAGAAHGGGLLAIADEDEAFPYAALGMNLFGASAVCLVSVPPVARLLRNIAGV